MANEKVKREKNQNIQVFVRLRPLNQREREIKSLNCIEVANTREVIARMSHQNNITKKFTFDRAFDPSAKQVDVYQEVVSPLIEEVLAGYNCTVFAYGQTGTGKTHTMVGENTTGSDIRWQDDPMAGIIPRSLSQLFDELRMSNTEYTVRVSYLELYNEELFDLLSASEDNSKLRIYEDITRKGSNIVNGLEEITVYNKNEVYKIMEQGQERKKVASTLMNAQSSRSHTVFTIVVHMKENSPEGEELVKIGKLNLVDLAGSENITKAGSEGKKERTRECVNINQSLLTLGRVITALVERHPHIPYRESKLTRLLQESLGGRTKTSIIATISPGHKDLEETLSTLEYAHRAKNIQNKPEVNQKLTKKAVLKEYSEEIDRLKRDLTAAREKNGVYLANETYVEMTLKMENQDKEIQEKILALRAISQEKERVEAIFRDMEASLKVTEEQLQQTKHHLSSAKHELKTTKQVLSNTEEQFKEQQHLVSKHVETEEKLSLQARDIMSVADITTQQLNNLHQTVDKRRTLEDLNKDLTNQYSSSAQGYRHRMRDRVNHFTSNITDELATLRDVYASQHQNYIQHETHNSEQINQLLDKMNTMLDELKQSREQCESEVSEAVSIKRRKLNGVVSDSMVNREGRFRELIEQLASKIETARQQDVESRRVLKDTIRELSQSMLSKLNTLSSEHDKYWKQILSHQEDMIAGIRRELSACRQENEHNAEIYTMQMKEMDEEIQHLQHELNKVREKRKKWCTDMITSNKKHNQTIENQITCLAELHGGGLAKLIEYDSNFVRNVSDNCEAVKKVSGEVVNVIDRVHNSTFALLTDTNSQMEEKMQSMLKEERTQTESLMSDCDIMFNGTVELCKKTTQTTQEHIQTYNETCKETMNNVASSCIELSLQMDTQQLRNMDTTQCLARSVSEFKDSINQQLSACDQIENKFLNEEYKVYSPTGKTPVRQEFRYPKQLAATSPHERIIQRFRSARGFNVNIQECVELDNSMEECRDDDTSSACSSEDSVQFLEPSIPPIPNSQSKTAPPTPTAKDIDKENLNLSNASTNSNSSQKYTSKLRPPKSAYKRTLVDKN